MVVAIDRPKLEGNIAVGENPQIGFAEFGAPQGRAGLGIPAGRDHGARALVAWQRRPHRALRARTTCGCDAELFPMSGESHLGGLGRAEEILRSIPDVWDRAGAE